MNNLINTLLAIVIEAAICVDDKISTWTRKKKNNIF